MSILPAKIQFHDHPAAFAVAEFFLAVAAELSLRFRYIAVQRFLPFLRDTAPWNDIGLTAFIPQSAVQRQSHELAVIVVNDGHRVFKGIACTNRAANRLLQRFQVIVNLNRLRMLPRCDLQHRKGILFLFHPYPPLP